MKTRRARRPGQPGLLAPPAKLRIWHAEEERRIDGVLPDEKPAHGGRGPYPTLRLFRFPLEIEGMDLRGLETLMAIDDPKTSGSSLLILPEWHFGQK
jgi:hypothetical protein